MVDDYERETRIRLPLTTLFVDDTVAGVAQAIRKGALDAYTDVVAVNGEGSRPPLVFVHGDFYTGGFHSHTLARMLGKDQPFYAVHPHGVAGGAVPESIEAMATERVRALRALRPRGPYVLCGHCNGAYVAFEMARQLRADGEPVPAVIIVDASAPGTQAGPSFDAAGITDNFVKYGGPVPTDRATDIGQRLHRAMRAYRASSLDAHVVFVRSALGIAANHDDDWSALGSTAEVHVLAGDHRSLILEEGGEPFVAVLREVIDRTAAAVGA
jgi:thioesterase domain-containing protein